MNEKIIIFASSNPGKLKEVKAMLEEENIKIMYLKDFPKVDEPIEDGNSFLENATIKAKYYYNHFKLPVLCDDSGLVVNALNGEPGIYSARYASKSVNQDLENMKKLLGKLKNIKNRDAYFNCTIVYYDGNNFKNANGKLEGVIIDTPKGNNGFGYDPIFVPNGYDKTLAEMTSDEKNKISHRHNALMKMSNFIKNELFNN